MPLSIFADALPFTEMKTNYKNWLPEMQLAELQPNIAYSSSLHWQLYCDKYPDDRQTLLDWGRFPEKEKAIVVLATLLQPFDHFGNLGLYIKKILDRVIYRRNAFANIPFKFRKDFSEIGQYLFWDKKVYGKEETFQGFEVISQDEGHVTFDVAVEKLSKALETGNPNIMFVTGFPDEIGHKTSRGQVYSQRLEAPMGKLQKRIIQYLNKYPDEEVLLVSDHGMSTINARIDLGLEERFGKQSRNTYIAYSDSCIMCIWSKKKEILKQMAEYLATRNEGHLLSGNEREYYRATSKSFGDLIYILREGNCFQDSWFGKSLRRVSDDGEGMHGFWPEREAKDQMASVVLISKHRRLDDCYTYPTVHKLIKNVMQGL